MFPTYIYDLRRKLVFLQNGENKISLELTMSKFSLK